MADPSGWEERTTSDGQLYYVNTLTEETSWDKPDALKTADELNDSGDWIWAPHPAEGYVLGRIQQTYHNGDVEVQTENFEVRTFFFFFFFFLFFYYVVVVLDYVAVRSF